MKKGIHLAIVTAMFAAMMCGCGKKDEKISDDFMDVQGTIETASKDNDSTNNNDFEIYDNDAYEDTMFGEREYETVDLPVDATVKYGDNRKANLYFDLQEWPSDIGGPMEATYKKMDENYIKKLADSIYDDGKYTIETDGAQPGSVFAESVYTQGTYEEKSVKCDLYGKVDGVDMYFTCSEVIEGNNYDPRTITLYRVDDEMSIGGFTMTEEEASEVGGNVCDRDEALSKANNYLKQWGLSDYECVSSANLYDFGSETTKANGYQFVFRKKIGTSLGSAYLANCFYNENNPFPSFFEQITLTITSKGLGYAEICDMYEVGKKKNDATLISKDEAIEKGTKAIEDYLNKHCGDNYLIWCNENKSVWKVCVDLSYVPIATEEYIEYRAVYIFSLHEDGYEKTVPIAAIDAETGKAYAADYMYSIEN